MCIQVRQALNQAKQLGVAEQLRMMISQTAVNAVVHTHWDGECSLWTTQAGSHVQQQDNYL